MGAGADGAQAETRRHMVRILICSYLEPEHVERVRQEPGVHVDYHPELLPEPRFPADHTGAPFQRTAKQRQLWKQLMERAEVFLDFDRTDVEGMRAHATSVRWIQATSAGIGGFVRRHRLDELGAILTTAAGVHSRPLAEFVLWSMLTFVKRYPVAQAQHQAHDWKRFCGDELPGKVLAVVGFGHVGREVAVMASNMGVRVLATGPSVGPHRAEPFVERFVPRERLHDLIVSADFVCLCLPQTSRTDQIVDASVLEAMKPGAVLINIGRGSLVDELALMNALDRGHLGGAVLDVVANEPLAPDHSLWSERNVILFPHSASTSLQENRRITDLFLDNLRRYQCGVPLHNVYDPAKQY